MNIYFFDPSHLKPQYFSYIAEALKVHKFYMLSANISPIIEDYCKDKVVFRDALDAFADENEDKSKINRAVFEFTDHLRKDGNLLDLYKNSSNNSFNNLIKEDIDDDNIMVILPKLKYEYENYNYVPKTEYPYQFASFSLNILRKVGDDRYAERLAFLLIDSYFSVSTAYVRKEFYRGGIKKSPVVGVTFKNKLIITKYIISSIIKKYPDFNDTNSKKIKDILKKILDENDFNSRNELVKELREVEKERKEAQNYSDEGYSRNELEDMYRDAFEGDPGYVWNID